MLTVLRGASFRPHTAQQRVLMLDLGDPLELELEPDNAYDPNAIKVIEPESSEFLGYIAKEDCLEVHGLLAVGPVIARVATLLGKGPQIEIILDDGSNDRKPEAS